MKTYGLRDIIGPIMVGPSSSHTAGALALASMARKLFGEQPERAVFTLYGSFAATGSGHGTDKALVAGILGLATDDPRVADAFALAKAAGVQVDIVWDTTTEVAHPNTVDIRCESREGAHPGDAGRLHRGRRGGHSAYQRHRRGHHRGTHERGRAPAR